MFNFRLCIVYVGTWAEIKFCNTPTPILGILDIIWQFDSRANIMHNDGDWTWR